MKVRNSNTESLLQRVKLEVLEIRESDAHDASKNETFLALKVVFKMVGEGTYSPPPCVAPIFDEQLRPVGLGALWHFLSSNVHHASWRSFVMIPGTT